MAYCPKCQFEYEAGIFRCPDCNVDLVEKLPEPVEPDHGTPGEDFVPLPEVEGGVYAEMVKGALDKRGIESYIHTEGFADTIGITGTGPVVKGYRVFVPASCFGECLDIQNGILQASQDEE